MRKVTITLSDADYDRLLGTAEDWGTSPEKVAQVAVIGDLDVWDFHRWYSRSNPLGGGKPIGRDLTGDELETIKEEVTRAIRLASQPRNLPAYPEE